MDVLKLFSLSPTGFLLGFLLFQVYSVNVVFLHEPHVVRLGSHDKANITLKIVNLSKKEGYADVILSSEYGSLLIKKYNLKSNMQMESNIVINQSLLGGDYSYMYVRRPCLNSARTNHNTIFLKFMQSSTNIEPEERKSICLVKCQFNLEMMPLNCDEPYIESIRAKDPTKEESPKEEPLVIYKGDSSESNKYLWAYFGIFVIIITIVLTVTIWCIRRKASNEIELRTESNVQYASIDYSRVILVKKVEVKPAPPPISTMPLYKDISENFKSRPNLSFNYIKKETRRQPYPPAEDLI